MTVRLRGHHLLCLLTFRGAGYGAAFVANMRGIAERLSAGEAAVIVAGPDDVCAPRLDAEAKGLDEPHCRLPGIDWRDAKALQAASDLLGRPLGPGSVVAFGAEEAARLRDAFAAGTIRAACEGCEWAAFCTDIATSDFAGTLLAPCGP
ncbi:DUF1284 domain-containing protein [Segnochrobactrum spirostomi]|uniref:DUF1284 domain-containing protein n=1 Tax=Segnochrobactrum spirostomi TaxID=2608987 RepID=A0A6A7Y2Z1_9HYPH|nr:DUF1284 domain-containing protein [Segnochrobactrum spirostomi]MQT12112.1 DUF1284 domain-containing protein [Segnochrobactrum spirostomi]